MSRSCDTLPPGVDGDISLSSAADNGFNPVWNETCEFDIINPTLAMIRIVVQDEDMFGDPNFVGQATFPVPYIKTGQSSYIAQYPVLRTAQSALHFISLTDLFTQTPSRLLWEASSHMLQLMREGCSFAYPPLSIYYITTYVMHVCAYERTYYVGPAIHTYRTDWATRF